ncbi:MAG: cytochrome b/b6 domain-containing protein [Variovorax sp.]|nr:cytochrome b/b6 domain-containing protein [Variovorax sp.]
MSNPRDMVRVWDPAQRLLHWGLVISVALAWWAGEDRLALHVRVGYVALAIVAVRTVWGLLGSRHARFSDFVSGPREVLGYARRIARGQEERHLGHNPLGGWMVVALLVCVAVICVSGFLYTTDAFWGVEWVEETHRVSAWTLVGLIAAHVAGVVFTSIRHRENLVAAMFSGRKPASTRRVNH